MNTLRQGDFGLHHLTLGKQAFLGKFYNLNLGPFCFVLWIMTDRKGCCYHARGQSATAMPSSRRVVTCSSQMPETGSEPSCAPVTVTAETCFLLVARPGKKPY